MESDSNDTNQFISTRRLATQVSKRFISAYMQHITDVCDPPRNKSIAAQ